MTDRERLIELISQIQYMGGLESRLAEHLLANGVIVPPCKVGDTVWINYEYSKSIIRTCPVKVYAYRIDTKKNNMRICVEGYIKISHYGGHYNHYYNGTFKWNSIGKSVFLTEEEAKNALKVRVDNG